jgi:hypothetical protein
MKYLIAYKQNDDYVYVNNIGTTIGKTTTYYSAMDFLTEENAKNVCEFLNDYDKTNNYVVVKYEYTLTEEN